MTEDDMQSMQGQVAALSAVIAQILSNLPALSAARIALNIAIDQDVQSRIDEEEGVSDEYMRSRNSVLSAYVELLQAVASNG